MKLFFNGPKMNLAKTQSLIIRFNRIAKDYYVCIIPELSMSPVHNILYFKYVAVKNTRNRLELEFTNKKLIY